MHTNQHPGDRGSRVVRQATIVDIPELVRLRRVIFEGHPAEHHRAWESRCAEYLSVRLERPDSDLCAVVVGDAVPGGPLAACAIGWIDQHLPSPVSEDGSLGYVGSVTTDASQRGQGLARRVLEALMEWFSERGVPRVELQTTPDAFSLYRKLGFTELSTPAMRWYRGGNPAEEEVSA